MLYQTPNPHGGDIYNDKTILDFSANTNPFGTPESVLCAIQNSLKDLHRYPDPYCRELIRALSAHEKLPAEYFLCGNGAAELIYSYCRALNPKTALETAPTFSEYSLALEQEGCRIYRYTLKPEWNFEIKEDFLELISDLKPEVVFLCNPNNPTGKNIDPCLLLRIADHCERKGIYLFVDECFLDLTTNPRSLKVFLPDHPHLLLLRAFTKSYGMAGIRLGYCMSADSGLLSVMARSVQPWNISTLAQAAGIAALADQDFLEHTRNYIKTERIWMCNQLRRLGFTVCEPEANYILFQADKHLDFSLKQYHISIRNCSNYHGLEPGWFRIAVRLHQENQELIHALEKIAAKTAE